MGMNNPHHPKLLPAGLWKRYALYVAVLLGCACFVLFVHNLHVSLSVSEGPRTPAVRGQEVLPSLLLNTTTSTSTTVNETYLEERVRRTVADATSLRRTATWPFRRDHNREVRILVVHVGKAGGASLNVRLRVLSQAPKFLACRVRRGTTETARIRDSCRDETPMSHNVSRLTHRIYGDVHLERPDETLPARQREWLYRHTNLLLFTVRDPVSRWVSAFNYHRWLVVQMPFARRAAKRGRMGRLQDTARRFYTCFDTVQQLADTLRRANENFNNGTDHTTIITTTTDDATDNTNFEDCASLGRDVLTGRRGGDRLRHFGHHYRRYMQRVGWTPSNHSSGGSSDTTMQRRRRDDDDDAVSSQRRRHVAVVRTERLWSDVARLETLLDGHPRRLLRHGMLPGKRVSHGSERYAVTSAVDDAVGAVTLCCTAPDELRAYQELIVDAVNLKVEEKVETLLALHRRCGRRRGGDSTEMTASAATLDDLAAWNWQQWASSSELCKA